MGSAIGIGPDEPVGLAPDRPSPSSGGPPGPDPGPPATAARGRAVTGTAAASLAWNECWQNVQATRRSRYFGATRTTFWQLGHARRRCLGIVKVLPQALHEVRFPMSASRAFPVRWQAGHSKGNLALIGRQSPECESDAPCHGPR